MGPRRKAEIIAARALSPSVRSLVLRTSDGSPVGHVAGQYIDVIVPTARGVPFKRPYSIASPPGPPRADEFEIAVTRVEGGPTSEALHAAVVGTPVEIEGPAGTFVRRESERHSPALFIATGTGLAPIRAMLAEEVRQPSARSSEAVARSPSEARDRAQRARERTENRREDDGPPLVLLFGCRTPNDLLWADELHEWERACPRYTLHVTLSRAPAEWTGLVGYVQRHARGLAESLPGVNAYVCGLSAMVDEVVRSLERDGRLPRRALHYEPYD